jgi:hypothetical protein
LVFDRLEGGLTGLEQSARRRQGYDPALERIRLLQEKQLNIWETSVKLLASIIEHRVSQALEPVGGSCSVKLFDHPLDLEDYVEVCLGRSVPRSWAFTLRLEIPGLPRLEKLAWIGHRSARMYQGLNHEEGGPALFWSHRNPDGFPRWIGDGPDSPFAVEITSQAGNGDEWSVRLGNDSIERVQTTELADRIAGALVRQALGD